MSRIGYFQDLLSSVFNRDANAQKYGDNRSLEELCSALLSERGEVTGNRLAASLLHCFSEANEAEQLEFFQMLVSKFDINIGDVYKAAQQLKHENSVEHFSKLLGTVEPKRQELFRRLNSAPGATGMLVDMRAKLLTHTKQHPELARIDIDLQKLFRDWFNRGFLVLHEIDWNTPANVLEKLIEYEAVHAISSWDALRRRLAPCDRKCFAFFHPSMLDEPLIFVEVALTKSTPVSIKEILIEDRLELQAQEADTAVFYSISNCQAGLAGVSFGNFLIKQVALQLSTQLSNLKTYRTLSPVPGFMRWVAGSLKSSEDQWLLDRLGLATQVATKDLPDPAPDQLEQLQELAARYLVQERRSDNQPLDPVARFHLGNGASLDKIFPQADVFDKGLVQSAGVMVSYLYNIDKVIANHEDYATNRKVICSDEVRVLLGERRKFLRSAS
jgi:malonyl-CoA decarboxylase